MIKRNNKNTQPVKEDKRHPIRNGTLIGTGVALGTYPYLAAANLAINKRLRSNVINLKNQGLGLYEQGVGIAESNKKYRDVFKEAVKQIKKQPDSVGNKINKLISDYESSDILNDVIRTATKKPLLGAGILGGLSGYMYYRANRKKK